MAGIPSGSFGDQRLILRRENPQSVRVLAELGVDEGKMKCGYCCLGMLFCTPCYCTNAGKLADSTYVSIQENRIEWNYPFMICCCFCDYTNVLYFDHIKKVQSPCCQPCKCCFGERVEIYTTYCPCCCPVSLDYLKDTKGTMGMINRALNFRKGGAGSLQPVPRAQFIQF